MPAAAARLPGIHFETVPRTAAPELPRMDIAAFAGFAATGPVGVPIPVEDIVRFGAVFGPDLPLAWDAAHGERAHAQLAAAVREFFRNGGRRCWVLRLAADAETSEFRLPGLLRQEGDAVAGAAWALAASPGSWADAVSVDATLLRTGVPAPAVEVVPGSDDDEAGILLHTDDAHGAASLLQVELPDGTIGYFPPASLEPRARAAAADEPADRRAGRFRPAALSTWFRPALPGMLPRPANATLHLLSGAQNRPLSLMSWTAGAEARFQIPLAQAAGIEAGAWLRLDLPLVPNSQFGSAVYLVVDDIDPGPVRATITARRGWRELVREPAWLRTTHITPRAALLSVELWAQRRGGPTLRIADVGLVPGHPRYFGGFPDDTALYAAAEQLVTAADPFLAEIGLPRFPLAAPPVMSAAAAPAPAAPAPVLLPLGLAALPREGWAQQAQHSGRSALERDGLAALEPELFLDPALATVPTARLLDEAFQLEHGLYAPQRAPTALHTLLKIEEASLLAVPDAVHPGWVRRAGADGLPPAPPGAPTIRSVRGPDTDNDVEVTWTAVRDATDYVLEYGPDPRFRERGVVSAAAATTTTVRLRASCRDRLWFRVHARGRGGVGPWSGTWLLGPPRDGYDRCGRTALAAPALRAVEDRGRTLRLRWSGAGERFIVERAWEPTFGTPDTVYDGPMRSTELLKPDSPAHFRVAAVLADEESPWSRTSSFVPVPPDRWELDSGDPAERITLLHTAMLRLCAARGDMVALLSLPASYREADALGHVARLDTTFGTGAAEAGDSGARVLSFGALHHPWLVVPSPRPDAPPRRTPADGAIAGVLAARALASGAWSVAANRPLAGVVALTPRLAEAARGQLFGRRVNLVVPDPTGFVVWSEETLSDVSELTGIGVRRLLILLRRLALREGMRYVFQPNDGGFRRLVQRQFDALLGDLFTRGAFAGARRSDGFRVVTDPTVNPRESVERGRLVVELRVAPSRPLHFLTVRLVQTGAGLSAAEA